MAAAHCDGSPKKSLSVNLGVLNDPFQQPRCEAACGLRWLAPPADWSMVVQDR